MSIILIKGFISVFPWCILSLSGPTLKCCFFRVSILYDRNQMIRKWSTQTGRYFLGRFLEILTDLKDFLETRPQYVYQELQNICIKRNWSIIDILSVAKKKTRMILLLQFLWCPPFTYLFALKGGKGIIGSFVPALIWYRTMKVNQRTDFFLTENYL